MENLGLDLKLLIAQLINFLVFFLIYKKFIAQSFLNFLNEEKKKNEAISALDQEIARKKEELVAEKKRMKEEVKKEIEQLKKSLMEEVKEEKRKVIEQAKKEAEIIKERAKKQALEMETKMKAEFKKKINELVITAFEAAFKDVLDEKEEKEITMRIFKNLKKTIN